MDTTRPSLLIRIRDRDDQLAWHEFDSIYRPLLRRYARAWGLCDAEVEDVVQQCMATIDRHITAFDYNSTRGRFKSWLRTMVSNRVKNTLRDRRDVRATTKDFDGLEEPGLSPEEVFDRLWRQEHLRHCLALIRPEVEESTFNAFVAYVMKEQPIEHVCAELAMTPNQVQAIKSRMIKRLRERTIELLGEEE